MLFKDFFGEIISLEACIKNPNLCLTSGHIEVFILPDFMYGI